MSGYDLNDPKHETYHERMADVWDAREKVPADTSTTAVYVMLSIWPPSLTGVHIPAEADDALVWAIGREHELRGDARHRQAMRDAGRAVRRFAEGMKALGEGLADDVEGLS